MKVLVTGAAGFLGRQIVTALQRRGVEPVGFDLEPSPNDVDVAWHNGSVLDPAAIAKAMLGAEAVIHAAAISDLWAPGRFTYDRVNGLGTCRILAEARRSGARVVHISSYTTLIDQDTTSNAMLTSETAVPPDRLLGPYPRTKRQAELFVEAAIAAGVEATMLLPTAPIGAGDHRPTPPGALIRDLALGRLPALLDTVIPVVDPFAVAEAAVSACTQPGNGKRYILSGENISTAQLAIQIHAAGGAAPPKRSVPPIIALGVARGEALLARLTGRRPTAPLTGVRLALRSCRFDSEPARRDLGFAPRSAADLIVEATEDQLRRPSAL